MKAKATDLSARGLGFEPRLCFFRGGRFFSFLPHFRTLFPLAMIRVFHPLSPFFYTESSTPAHTLPHIGSYIYHTTESSFHLPHDRVLYATPASSFILSPRAKRERPFPAPFPLPNPYHVLSTPFLFKIRGPTSGLNYTVLCCG